MENKNVPGPENLEHGQRGIIFAAVGGVLIVIIAAAFVMLDFRSSSDKEVGSIATGNSNGSVSGDLQNPGIAGFEEPMCGFVIPEHAGWSVDYTKGGGVSIVSGGSEVLIACADEIPGIPLPANLIEDVTVDGVAGKLYHDASARDGEPMDDIRVKHPKTSVDVTMRGTPGLVGQVGAEFTWMK